MKNLNFILLYILLVSFALFLFSSFNLEAFSLNKSTSDLPGGEWKTNTEKRSIELSELRSGGPPKDGIPSIDNPNFVPTKDANNWLKGKEPVISLVLDGEARAYPLQILIWHEIVNDKIGNIPLIVTFCPLCYSAIVYERIINGMETTFGVSGMLRNSDMVMYDRRTESLWQQLTGEAIVGELTETKLKRLPSQIISFKQFTNAYNDGFVLSRETGHIRDYGKNPYIGYDDISKSPFLFEGEVDDRLPPMEKVITVSIGELDRAYPYSITSELHVIHDKVGEQQIVIFHSDGAVSALDKGDISSSKDVGSTGVFEPIIDGIKLNFQYKDGNFRDSETNSIWDITGTALEGELKGKKLKPINHGDYFTFAWFAFKPDTEIFHTE